MNTKQAVEFLRRYDQWRRGKIIVWGGDGRGPDPREVTQAIDVACAALEAKQPAAVRTEPFLNFNLTQAMALVESFGGLDGDMAVQWFPKSTDVETGEPMPEGLYAYCYDYPEEGRQWLGDPMAEITAHVPAAQQPAVADAVVVRLYGPDCENIALAFDGDTFAGEINTAVDTALTIHQHDLDADAQPEPPRAEFGYE